MRINNKKFLSLLLFLIIIFILFFIKKSYSFDCSNGGTGCLGYDCLSDGSCYQGICSEGICSKGCISNSDCDDGNDLTLDTCNPVKYICTHTLKFSANGVCEYDDGERIGYSQIAYIINGRTVLFDDCDYDNDGYYDHCGKNNVVDDLTCEGEVNYINTFPDYCPGTKRGDPVSDDYHKSSGCSCEQIKEKKLCNGISVNCLASLTDLSVDNECLKNNNINLICSYNHPNCYTADEIANNEVEEDVIKDICLATENIAIDNDCTTKKGENGICNEEGECIVNEEKECTFNCSELNNEDSCIYYKGINITYNKMNDCYIDDDLKAIYCLDYKHNKSKETTCSSGVCDGKGNCVECLSDDDCEESFICKDNICKCPENKINITDECIYESCSSNLGLFCEKDYKEPEIINNIESSSFSINNKESTKSSSSTKDYEEQSLSLKKSNSINKESSFLMGVKKFFNNDNIPVTARVISEEGIKNAHRVETADDCTCYECDEGYSLISYEEEGNTYYYCSNSCSKNNDCPESFYCEDNICQPLNCENGIINNHACSYCNINQNNDMINVDCNSKTCSFDNNIELTLNNEATYTFNPGCEDIKFSTNKEGPFSNSLEFAFSQKGERVITIYGNYKGYVFSFELRFIIREIVCLNKGVCEDYKIINNECFYPETYEENERSCDGLDNDCDGEVDEGLLKKFFLDNDNDGYGSKIIVFVCEKNSSLSSNSDDCDDNNESINPGAKELFNGRDDNCNNVVDEGFSCSINEMKSCYSGPSLTLNKGVCKAGVQYCENGFWGSCIGEVTPKDEVCDNLLDDDCDGKVDCEDNDCLSDDSCKKEEICNNLLDDDNDNKIDCEDEDCFNNKFCLCGNNKIDEGEECDGKDFNGLTCKDYGFNNGFLKCIDCKINTDFCFNKEICNNNIDDDNDNKIDFEDDDCSCYPLSNCNNQCVNLSSDLNNCGACGAVCDGVCKNGVCINNIVCNNDEDCDGLVCVNPGTKDSYCDEPNLLIINDSKKEEIINNIISLKAFSYKLRIKDDYLLISLNNLINKPLLLNLSVFVPFNLPVSSANYDFEKEGNKLFFNNILLDSKLLLKIKINYLDNKHLDYFKINGSYIVINDTNNIFDSDPFVLKKSYEISNNSVFISLQVSGVGKNVNVPIELPKCLLNNISNIKLPENVVVVNDDPLIVWSVRKLKGSSVINLRIPSVADENCLAKINSFAYGKKEDLKNPILIPLLIPLIVFLMIFINYFNYTGAEVLLSKKEFYEIGRKKGMDEESLKRAWQDYQLRFKK